MDTITLVARTERERRPSRSERRLRSSRAIHLTGLVGTAVILSAVLAITLSPTPVDAGKGDAVEATLRYLHGIGMPDSFGYTELEFTANILMFVPLGAFVAMALPRERYWAGLIGLPALSAVIELAQHTALAGRTGSLGDILANSLGAWLGLAAGAAVTSWNRRAMR